MTNPTAAMIVIGDEILSGRTRDSNMHHIATRLTEHGIDLIEARMISDSSDTICATVRELRAQADYVFTSGGIGPTHDDITADAIAQAFGVAIGVRSDARAILERYYSAQGKDLNAARLRMARIPDGATLIENPISAAPGFRIENVFVMAGVPRIFEVMLDGVLPSLRTGQKLHTVTVPMMRGEGDVAEALRDIAARYPVLSIGSYPFMRDGVQGTNIVLRGLNAQDVQQARMLVEELL